MVRIGMRPVLTSFRSNKPINYLFTVLNCSYLSEGNIPVDLLITDTEYHIKHYLGSCGSDFSFRKRDNRS